MLRSRSKPTCSPSSIRLHPSSAISDTSHTHPTGCGSNRDQELPSLAAHLCANYCNRAQRRALLGPFILESTQQSGNYCAYFMDQETVSQRAGTSPLSHRQDLNSDLADGKVKAQTLNCYLLYTVTSWILLAICITTHIVTAIIPESLFPPYPPWSVAGVSFSPCIIWTRVSSWHPLSALHPCGHTASYPHPHQMVPSGLHRLVRQ